MDSDGVWDTGWLTTPTLEADYGDDLSGMLKLEVTDGEDTSADFAYYVVDNVAPAVTLSSVVALSVGEEGDTLAFKVQATDPGSDDLTYSWSGECSGWPTADILYPNDPLVIPDPYPSPDMNPRDVTNTQTVVCGDDGLFKWEVQVEDDDGGLTTLKGTFTLVNLPPMLTVSPPSFVKIDEGVELTLDATATDPGSDDLTFTWDWEHGPTVSKTYYNDGIGPDQPKSPGGTFPFTATDSSTHTYGDDCLCNVTLRVEDDDGGNLTYVTTVEVHNAPPALVGNAKAYATGDLTLRVAGEKWHDVELKLYDNGVSVGVASIMRVPGSPDRQSVTIEDVVIELFNGSLVAVIEYTPLDDPINGQINGANPAWLIFTPNDGGEEHRLHHTFNVRHPETWIWTVAEFNTFLVGVNITFESVASDPGSDDLTFAWDLGDGTTIQHLYCNAFQCPDPYPSPDVNPMTIMDRTIHRYDEAGVYTTVLRVRDDDGGETMFIKDIKIG